MNQERKYRTVKWQILFGSIVTFANLYSYQALLPILVQEFSITPAKASLTVSIPTLVLAFSLLIMAVISDTYGRKKMMGISLVGAACMNLFVPLSKNYETILLIRGIQGVLLAGFPAIAMTYLSEEIDSTTIGRIMAIYISGTGIGGFLGRITTSAISDIYTWKIAIFCMGIISLAFAYYFIKKLPPSQNFVKRTFSVGEVRIGMKRALLNRQLVPLYFMAFLLLGSFSTIFNYVAFPLSEAPFSLGYTLIGLFFVFQLTGTMGSILAGRLIEKYHRYVVILLGAVLFIAGAFLTTTASLLFFCIGLFFIGIGFFASHSLASGWVGIIAPAIDRSYASSYYLLFYYLGASIMGTLGGWILLAYKWQGVVWFVMAGFLGVIGLSIVIPSLLKERQK